MAFVKEQIKRKGICCTSVTFDLGVYWKASEIKEDVSPEFDCIHLKLGGFHQLMSFMGAGCKLMEDAGLKEVWSTLYKENSISFSQVKFLEKIRKNKVNLVILDTLIM